MTDPWVVDNVGRVCCNQIALAKSSSFIGDIIPPVFIKESTPERASLHLNRLDRLDGIFPMRRRES
jgi:hypothetical protein